MSPIIRDRAPTLIQRLAIENEFRLMIERLDLLIAEGKLKKGEDSGEPRPANPTL